MHSVIGTVLGAGFGAISRLRGHRRSLHPEGAGFALTLTPEPDAPDIDLLRHGSRRGVARLSRAFGLPDALPDVLGLAFRIPDAYGSGRHQDLLLATTGRARGLRHLFAPARGFLDPTYSTLVPYRAHGDLVTIGALPVGGGGTPLLLDDLRARDDADLAFDLAFASPTGDWRTVARLTLGERLDPARTEALRLDPDNAGGGLRPAALARIRHDAYRGSQQGRV